MSRGIIVGSVFYQDGQKAGGSQVKLMKINSQRGDIVYELSGNFEQKSNGIIADGNGKFSMMFNWNDSDIAEIMGHSLLTFAAYKEIRVDKTTTKYYGGVTDTARGYVLPDAITVSGIPVDILGKVGMGQFAIDLNTAYRKWKVYPVTPTFTTQYYMIVCYAEIFLSEDKPS
jgi:hypothetical protein